MIIRGADLNVTDGDGWTPLHRACADGHESVVTALINGRADLNVTDVQGCTPLHDACSQGHVSTVTSAPPSISIVTTDP
jgi:ankyrin repeat protein